MRRALVWRWLVTALAATAAGSVPASAPASAATTAPAATVVYRCTSPQGAVSLQDDSCPAGHRSERREIPAFAPPTAPPLWRCTDLNGKDRLVDTFDPQPRCVPLSVLGVDLSRAPPSAANLCRMVEDPCVELSGDAACAAWKERLEAAEAALRTAFSDTAAQRRRERDRAEAVLKADCGG